MPHKINDICLMLKLMNPKIMQIVVCNNDCENNEIRLIASNNRKGGYNFESNEWVIDNNSIIMNLKILKNFVFDLPENPDYSKYKFFWFDK